MQAQPSTSVVSGRRGAPVIASQSDPGMNAAYESELCTWARSQTSGLPAIDRIVAWLIAANTGQTLDLSGLALTSLPPLPAQVTMLDAADNKLTYLSETLPALAVLDVSNNSLTRLPEALPVATLKVLKATCNTIRTVPFIFNLLQPGCEIYLDDNPGLDPRVPDNCFCDLQYFDALRQGALARVKATLSAFPHAAACSSIEHGSPLHIACSMGYVEIVDLLLRMPQLDVNASGSDGRTPLIAAICARHEMVAQLLLAQHDIAPNCADTEGNTALHHAIANGDHAMLKRLLDCPMVDIHTTTPDGLAPIAQAGAEGDVSLVEALLEKMTNNREIVKHACSMVLFMAARNGHNKVVELMVKKYRSDPNVSGHASGILPLCVAAHYGQTETVKLLLRCNADPNVRLPDGTPALMMGIVTGRLDLFKAMLSHPQINPNFADTSAGMTPLCYAAYAGALDFVKLLLTHSSVDINLADKQTVTPLLRAAHSGNVEILQCLLLDKRLMVNKAGSDGSTALIECCFTGSAAAVKLLLQHEKIDLYARRSNGGTALKMAAGTGKLDIVRLLMSAMMGGSEQARIEAADGLIQAIHTESAEMAELLLAMGADPNQIGTQGIVPLQLLVESAYDGCAPELRAGIMICLLKAGAKIASVSSVNVQKTLVYFLGGHVIEVMTAATEPLKRESGGEVFSLVKAGSAAAMQKIADAEAMLTTISQMPDETQCALLAGVALNSVNAFDLVLAEHPLLEKLVKSVHGNDQAMSQQMCGRIHANMKLWDGSGIDGAGHGTFSVLQTTRDRLPPCTRNMLAIWKI